MARKFFSLDSPLYKLIQTRKGGRNEYIATTLRNLRSPVLAFVHFRYFRPRPVAVAQFEAPSQGWKRVSL